MERYLIAGIILKGLVSTMLMLTVQPLSSPAVLRALAAAGVEAVFSLVGLVPSMVFLQHPVWRGCIWILSCIMAFGIQPGTLRKGAVCSLLRLALEGIASGSMAEELIWSVVLLGVCRWAFGRSRYVRVCFAGGIQCRALLDTGHQLRDPVTGRPVLVVDAAVAEQLTGLTAKQLSRPMETVQRVPGLRLIPYRSVGGTGLLLCRSVSQVQIGTWRGSTLVAFSPEILDGEGMYQALIGGVA